MSIARTVAEIATLVDGRVVGDATQVIRGLARIEEAGPEDLTFVANARYVKFLDSTRAGAVLVNSTAAEAAGTLIVVSDPYACFMRLLKLFHPTESWLPPGVHPSAVIDPSATIAENVAVGAQAYIGPRCRVGSGTQIFPQVAIAADVWIGENCVIHSRVSIREHVRIGDRVVVQDGAVIGSDGFGFAPGNGGYEKIPQLGTVVIADDVEIGANTTIDRATLGETAVGRGSKLDNLVHVAHNASVGSNTVIAAQSGISGSTRVGDNCMIGGQVGFVGHLRVGNGVKIGAQSGVARDVSDGEVVSGSPARPHSLWKRIEATVSRLPDIYRRLCALEQAVYGVRTRPEDKS